MTSKTEVHVAVFDLDGTLLNSDEALLEPFRRLGVPEERITFGHPIVEFCTEVGISVDEYVDMYDTDAADPFEGCDDLVATLSRASTWGICSNKHPRSGVAELDRLGWAPDVAAFTDRFGGAAKRLAPVVTELGCRPEDVVYVGDTAHDRACAREAGCAFAWAGWNPRVRRSGVGGDWFLDSPARVLELIGLS